MSVFTKLTNLDNPLISYLVSDIIKEKIRILNFIWVRHFFIGGTKLHVVLKLKFILYMHESFATKRRYCVAIRLHKTPINSCDKVQLFLTSKRFVFSVKYTFYATKNKAGWFLMKLFEKQCSYFEMGEFKTRSAKSIKYFHYPLLLQKCNHY